MPTPPRSPRVPMRALAREVPRLVSLALPLIAGLTASTLTAVVDTVMLAPLGEIPLAVVSLSASGLSVLYAGLYGFMGPVAIYAGHAYGAGAPDRVAGALFHGLAVGGTMGVLATLIMVAALPTLRLMDQPPLVLAALTPYWLWIAASMAPFTMLLAFKQVYDGVDRAWLAMGLMTFGGVLNIPLNWIFIYGHLGVPALGVTGAGIASFLSTTCTLLIMVLHWALSAKMAAYRVPIPLSRGGIWAQLRDGLPMGAQYAAEGGAFALAGLMIGWFGATALAANQIVSAVTLVIYMGPLGMSAAVSIRVAQALGEGGRERAGAIGWAALLVVMVWMSLFTISLALGGGLIAALMVEDPDVIDIAARLFTVVALMQILDGVQSTSLGALRGLLDIRWPTIVTLISYWLLALPSSYLLGVVLGLGPEGVWAGFGVGLCVAAIALTWRFQRLTHNHGGPRSLFWP